MIKKFQEFIEEGFLSKTINRSKSGELRKEDVSPIDAVCNLLSQILCKKFDIPFEKIFTWEEVHGYNKNKYYFKIFCNFKEIDNRYVNISFLVDDVKIEEKDYIHEILVGINNGFIHERDRNIFTMFDGIKKEYEPIQYLLVFVFDAIQAKMKYTHKQFMVCGRPNYSKIDPDEVDVDSLLDPDKDIDYNKHKRMFV